MMTQEIITYIIIFGAIAYVVYSIVTLVTKSKDDSFCGSCSCDAKKQFRKKK